LPLDAIAFYVLAVLAVAASLMVIGQRNPIHSVLLLIASFMALAGLYVLLDAPFVAVIQIIIYAGAIMVLFLFVVMLLNAPREQEAADIAHPPVAHGPRRLGALLAVVFAVELVWLLNGLLGGTSETGAEAAAPVSSVREIGRVLFTQYGFAFEVTSILIIVAMVGAVVLAKREI
jgi:NADH-quinone oxidoreductase subunit J